MITNNNYPTPEYYTLEFTKISEKVDYFLKSEYVFRVVDVSKGGGNSISFSVKGTDVFDKWMRYAQDYVVSKNNNGVYDSNKFKCDISITGGRGIFTFSGVWPRSISYNENNQVVELMFDSLTIPATEVKVDVTNLKPKKALKKVEAIKKAYEDDVKQKYVESREDVKTKVEVDPDYIAAMKELEEELKLSSSEAWDKKLKETLDKSNTTV